MSDEPSPSDTPVSVGHISIREPPLVLVPVAVLEGQTIPDSLVSFLAPSEVVVLGYHVVPEQTPVEQASMQFEERAQAAVEDIARTFADSERAVDTRVAFTHDREKTIDRVADEVSATAVLLPNPTGHVSDVLVPIRGAIDVDRLADLVGTLLGDVEGTVTLWALDTEGNDVANRTLAENARQKLEERGIADDRVSSESTVTDTPIRAIVDRSDEFDVVVMGEGGPSLLSSILGDTTERVAEGTVAPVLAVRKRQVK